MVVLFAHKASKFRETEHESRDDISNSIRRSRHVDSYSYFPIVWSGSKGGGKKVIKGLKLGERKVDTSKPLSRPILISCKLSRIPRSVSKQRSNSQFTLTCWSKEGIVWEWSGVKGYVKVCSVSMCHRHLKMHVLVHMRHRWLDILAIWQNIDNLVLFSCDLGLFTRCRPLRLPLTLEVASQSSLHRSRSPCMVIVTQHGRCHGFAKSLEVATCK